MKAKPRGVPLIALLAPAKSESLIGHLEGTAIAIVVAFVVWRLAFAAIDRFFGRRFVSRFIPRVSTFSSLTKSIVSLVVVVALILVLLNIWAVNVAPAIWSAGILTAALAFGAQTLVRDVLTGFFFLMEDQYDVGDSVEFVTTVNSVIRGTVETIGLRTTRVVDDRGRHFIIPNGNILYVSNASRLPNRSHITVTVPLRANVSEMRAKIAQVAGQAVAQASQDAGDVAVSVDDVHADAAVFGIEFLAPKSRVEAAEDAVRERVVAQLQTEGWLPAGSATAS